jgi:hypothetical protein
MNRVGGRFPLGTVCINITGSFLIGFIMTLLVGAAADQFRELARVPAIEGKTWNHPVLVGDRLLVRNGQEMAAFRLSLALR